MSMKRVVIADDHPIYRDGLAQTLTDSGSFEVVGCAASGREAVELAGRLAPDIVLLDLSMPDGGVWALGRIAALDPAPVVAMLTVAEGEEEVVECLSKGAAGYILKGVGGRELLSVLNDLAAGRSYVAPTLAGRVLTRLHSPSAAARDPGPIERLSHREEEILKLVAHGLSNKEIGLRLAIQEKTVKHYMTQIMQTLQVRNRTEAALAAERHWGAQGR